TLPSALRRVKEFRSLNGPDRAGANAAIERGVVAAIGSIGAATLASRGLGYPRGIVVARAFGARPVTPPLFVARRSPTLLRRLLAEGALSTGVVPVLSATLGNRGPIAFVRTVQVVAGAGLVVLCVVSALGMILARPIVSVMAPGWRTDPGLFDLAVTLTRLMVPL